MGLASCLEICGVGTNNNTKIQVKRPPFDSKATCTLSCCNTWIPKRQYHVVEVCVILYPCLQEPFHSNCRWEHATLATNDLPSEPQLSLQLNDQVKSPWLALAKLLWDSKEGPQSRIERLSNRPTRKKLWSDVSGQPKLPLRFKLKIYLSQRWVWHL